jgi:hypothetical protein
MGNDITRNPIYIDTAGVVTTGPIWIKKIVLVPTATTATAVLKYWEEDEESVRVHMKSKTASGTDSNTLTSTGNLTSANAVATDAIHIYESSTGNNIGTWEISVAGDNDKCDVLPATLTTESDKTYSWKVYASYPLASLNNATFPPCQMDFNPPQKVPNLMVTTLTTGTLYIYS